jgi:hypothetical protein
LAEVAAADILGAAKKVDARCRSAQKADLGRLAVIVLCASHWWHTNLSVVRNVIAKVDRTQFTCEISSGRAIAISLARASTYPAYTQVLCAIRVRCTCAAGFGAHIRVSAIEFDVRG